ncbi:MAG: DNA polymerase I [Anaeroplasmataceae bacterium]
MKKVVLIDGNSLMYKAYYASTYNREPIPNSKGAYTNALMLFVQMVNNLESFNYDYILVAFDKGKKTLRHEHMPDYKDGRKPMPSQLREQIDYIKKFLDIKKIKHYDQELVEADDIIGTICQESLEKGYHVDMFSSDKDLLQLITDNSLVHLTSTGTSNLITMDSLAFEDKYGIKVEQFIDYKAIVGDSSDNIKGAPGIGEKTAVKLLNEYNTLENLISNASNLKGKNALIVEENKELLLTYKHVVTIDKFAELNICVEDTLKQDFDINDLSDFYQEFELNKLFKDLQVKLNSKTEFSKKIDFNFKLVNNDTELSETFIDDTVLLVETFNSNYHKEDIIGLTYVNKLGKFILDLKLLDSITFKKIIEESNFKISTYNYKKTYVLLKKHNITLPHVDFDLLLAVYLIDPNIAKKEIKEIGVIYRYNDLYFNEEIYSKGVKKSISDINFVYEHIVKQADFIQVIKPILLNQLEDLDQINLLNSIEIPLSKVLAEMEIEGVKIDKQELLLQKNDLSSRILELEKTIYSLTNTTFNISSPKQLGEVLFEKLALKSDKKNKSKSGYSTSSDILEKLVLEHEVIPYILEYKTLTKIYSTYIEGLANNLFSDGKLHTIYEQALTNTGRLSSVEPNLQNISVRTAEGKNIRKLFIPSNENNYFFTIDYSQIELRVLAHLANVKSLIEAFDNDIDIHTKTACEIFDKEFITNDDRRKAKAVNFGIIYGQTPYGLSEELNISPYEASNYIKSYFKAYPEIETYMSNVVEYCKETGYVKTIKNRIRFIKDINSSNRNLREYAQRTAMNTPIQGSAADILKIAMIDIFNYINKNNLKSKMLLTVHDEVIFEVIPEELDIFEKQIPKIMCECIKLICPLKTEFSYAKNWFEAK